MDKPADNVLRKLINIRKMTVDGIIFQDRDNLVVRLVMVKQTESSDRSGANDYIAVGDVLFSKDANIKRVAVALHVIARKRLIGKLCHV